MKLTQKILLTNLIILGILFILAIIPGDFYGSESRAFSAEESAGIMVFILGIGLAAINLGLGIILLLLHLAMKFSQTNPENYLSLVGAFLLSAAVVVLLAIPMCFLPKSLKEWRSVEWLLPQWSQVMVSASAGKERDQNYDS